MWQLVVDNAHETTERMDTKGGTLWRTILLYGGSRVSVALCFEPNTVQRDHDNDGK